MILVMRKRGSDGPSFFIPDSPEVDHFDLTWIGLACERYEMMCRVGLAVLGGQISD